MLHKQLLLTLTVLLLSGLRSEATTYTVKTGGGGNYTTISACAAVAVAGDTCQVYAGSYAGWTQPTSGTGTDAAHAITFTVNPGDSVTINSQISVAGRSYIYIGAPPGGGGCASSAGTRAQLGLTFKTAGCFTLSASQPIAGDQNTTHIWMTYNNFSAVNSGAGAFNIADGIGRTGTDNVFAHNEVIAAATGLNILGLYWYGDRGRAEYNYFNNFGDDCMDIGGANWVIRFNICNGLGQNPPAGVHSDFIQIIGGNTAPTLSFSLIEGNVIQNCTQDGGNCHGFAIIRNQTAEAADTIIIRYNEAQNIDGDCINFGGSGDNVPNGSAYNNTCATEHLATYNASFDSTQGTTPNTTVFNNIAYNVETGGWYPFLVTPSGYENGNLAYTVGFSGSWPAPYSSEATYSALANKDPQFASYPTDLTLKSGSPAHGAGVAGTTTSGSGSNGTSLVVGNSHLFQPGWSGVNGDCIRVGALVGSPTTCITAINYSTNTLTISPAINWNSGDPVFLYKTSDGTVVLTGTNPDVGAFQFGGAVPGPPPPPSAPMPPSGLTAIVH